MTKTAFVIVFSILLCTGCASSNYFMNRGQDAADILTLTCGSGTGLKGRVGPFHLGLLHAEDRAGLRGGSVKKWDDCIDIVNVVPIHYPDTGSYGPEVCTAEDFEVIPSNKKKDRGKGYRARGTKPFFVREIRSTKWEDGQLFHPYFTQLEVVLGLGVSLRAGVNPGEAIDFLLGFINIDFFGDDLKREE
jgi:hypothetical protein